jgi:hypothetical protein
VKRPSLDEVAMRAVPRKKKKPRMRLTRFYCSKCREDYADHRYEDCPTWRQCGFCDQQGHWSFDCTTPHVKCTRYRCGVHVGHRNIGELCPWSKEVKRYNFNYDCDGQVCDLDRARRIYGDDLDWSSCGLTI